MAMLFFPWWKNSIPSHLGMLLMTNGTAFRKKVFFVVRPNPGRGSHFQG
jgi:hypothetical protein